MTVKRHVKLRFKTEADSKVIDALCQITRMSLEEFTARALQAYSAQVYQGIENERKRLAELAAKTVGTDANGSPVISEGPSGGPADAQSELKDIERANVDGPTPGDTPALADTEDSAAPTA